MRRFHDSLIYADSNEDVATLRFQFLTCDSSFSGRGIDRVRGRDASKRTSSVREKILLVFFYSGVRFSVVVDTAPVSLL